MGTLCLSPGSCFGGDPLFVSRCLFWWGPSVCLLVPVLVGTLCLSPGSCFDGDPLSVSRRLFWWGPSVCLPAPVLVHGTTCQGPMQREGKTSEEGVLPRKVSPSLVTCDHFPGGGILEIQTGSSWEWPFIV